MYHLKLIKALSYSGIVTATQKRPDVFTEDKTIADKAVATGYFKLGNTESSLPNNDHNADDFISDGIMLEGEDDGNAGDSTQTDEKPQRKTFDDMTRAELETFATYKNVSVKGLPKKSDIIAKLRDVLGSEETSGITRYGSPTMVELQQE